MIHNSPLPSPAPSPALTRPSSSQIIPALDDSRLRLIAQHYLARSNRTLEQRETSPIIHLKKLHNWIKSVLIQLHTRRGDSVLDLACGKGGDIAKWDKAQIGYYVGVDIVERSLEQARKRYNEVAAARMARMSGCCFPARLVCGDCYGEWLREGSLKSEAAFDVCSCQFALHYSWSSERRARAALGNVAALLKPGGVFIGTIPDMDVILSKLRDAKGSMEIGNRLYKVKFERSEYEKAMRGGSGYGVQYEFHLEDAVDHCPEWLVPFGELRKVAEEYGLELVSRKNFHEFVQEQAEGQGQQLPELMGSISSDEWDCVSIYLTFVFRKPRLVSSHPL